MMFLNYLLKYFQLVLLQLIILGFMDLGEHRNLLRHSQKRFKEYLDLILHNYLKIGELPLKK